MLFLQKSIIYGGALGMATGNGLNDRTVGVRVPI
jgi:hypothetical protein